MAGYGAGGAVCAVGAVMVETRPFRPFKSAEEYVFAMKEDLAEWLTALYPELRVTAHNFLDRLDSGVALCRHANAVRERARCLADGSERAESEQAVELARSLLARPAVSLLPAAKPGTFFARDNLSNFIEWCRRALGILECLLFETDDLCLRKNEKHVVLCLLEVARRGAELGMPAPLLVQMERQIDRELAGQLEPHTIGLAVQQVVTNDLRSLDERVRDLLARCTCPTQFPMVRVSEGKYRIGDTKVLIFVRILRSHVMVRVGGGWDTLQHYLDKHDPCRCRAAHRAARAAHLHPASARAYADLAGSTVTYDRASSASLSSPSRAIQRAESPARRSPRPASPAPRRSPRPASPPPPASESASDNGSEFSDEGYRSLGLLASPPAHPAHPAPRTPPASPECGDEARVVSASTGLRRTERAAALYGSPRRALSTPPHNTWSGRAPRCRASVTPDSFNPPARAASPASSSPVSAAPVSATPVAPALCRGGPLRASCSSLRSPLAQHILRSAHAARDDRALLHQVKRIVRQYSAGGGGGESEGEDSAELTRAWVCSGGARSASPAPRRARSAHPAPTRIPAPLYARVQR